MLSCRTLLHRLELTLLVYRISKAVHGEYSAHAINAKAYAVAQVIAVNVGMSRRTSKIKRKLDRYNRNVTIIPIHKKLRIRQLMLNTFKLLDAKLEACRCLDMENLLD